MNIYLINKLNSRLFFIIRKGVAKYNFNIVMPMAHKLCRIIIFFNRIYCIGKMSVFIICLSKKLAKSFHPRAQSMKTDRSYR